MNIIFNRTIAEELRERYLVLELETLLVDGQRLECFCVVPGDKIPASEVPTLDHFAKLHQTLVDNLKRKNYGICEELIGHLAGRFGGEMDSFYQVIVDRIKGKTPVQ